ncbi:YitT family protein [Tissierella creatinini]|nr:YitT family protein [Tissierella creatinini]TJX63068.1 YitT family protein [Soehngenia saccharolytica]
MNEKIKKFLIINIGLVISACGLYYFLIPSSLAVGGATGLALVISTLIPSINYSLILIIINIILFIAAFIVLGKEFGGYTLYASLMLSGIFALLEIITPMTKPFTDDLFINLIFGILIAGVGIGIVFNQNASTGGTDIVAKIINKFFHIDMGKSLMIPDFLITLFAGFVFGPRLGMYSLLGVIINSIVIDKIIAGFNVKVNMIIISREFDAINDYINKNLERGTTIYHATGGYSKEDKKIINTIVERSEYIKIRDFIRAIDKRAFVTISHITEVEGEGFTYD